MNRLLIASISLYLRLLARILPKTAGRRAYALFRTPRSRRPVPSSVEHVMARAETFDLRVDGERVAGFRWRLPDGRPTDLRAMLIHGWESRTARLAVWVEPLLEAGFEVVAFDAPAHGESSGKRADPRVFADAIRATVEHTGPINVCIAHSMGAISAMVAAAGGRLTGHEDIRLDRWVAIAGAENGVNAMSIFCRVLKLGDGFLDLILAAAAEAAGRPMSDFDGHRLLAGRDLPTLWLHDPADEIVSIEGAERVAAANPGVRLERLDGLGHNDIARDPEVIRRSVKFLRG